MASSRTKSVRNIHGLSLFESTRDCDLSDAFAEVKMNAEKNDVHAGFQEKQNWKKRNVSDESSNLSQEGLFRIILFTDNIMNELKAGSRYFKKLMTNLAS